MSDFFGIYSFRIIDVESGNIILYRIYNSEESADYPSKTFLSTIMSFSQDSSLSEAINTLIIKNRKVVMEKIENLAFILVVSTDYEIFDAKRMLSHARATFLRRYPIKDCEWQFTVGFNYFKGFIPILDEIILHFRETRVVIKIVLMGIDYAGKTTLTHAYAGSSYQSYLPTTGLDILRIEYRGVHIRLWDLGGQAQFRKLWPKFATEASGMIFVVDSATQRWAETKEAFEISKLFQLPFVIFANKQDLVEKALSLELIAQRLNVPIEKVIRGSALLGEGVFEVLDHLIEEITQND